MAVAVKRYLFAFFLTILIVIAFRNSQEVVTQLQEQNPPYPGYNRPYKSKWKSFPQKYPVKKFEKLPDGKPIDIPKIQHDFPEEKADVRTTRETRLKAVRDNFQHAWQGYRKHAWLKDEVRPIDGGSRDAFGGWAATLVDSLDTLWIMGLKKEFNEAVAAVGKINFNECTENNLNVFETTIRYLGGFLSAYDLSGRKELLGKAIEVGDLLMAAFDTENRMPITRWDWKEALAGHTQSASTIVLVAEIGSLSLEFTRLSQLTGDPKYFDAVQRITNLFQRQQKYTRIPGLWPMVINAKGADLTANTDFTLGAMADSLYEYLPKEYMLLGGLRSEYKQMYELAIDAAKEHLFYKFKNPQNLDLLMSGTRSHGMLIPEGQHLVCFVGGMVGIGAKIFNRDELDTARKLVDACIWAYEAIPQGIMPEVFSLMMCENDCKWNQTEWQEIIQKSAGDFHGTFEELLEDKRIPPGFATIRDRRYMLRPEAIESVFIMYRITGDATLMDKGWKMFQAIEKHTRTPIAHSALHDVTQKYPIQVDKMESFWTAETLKYFYLLFSEPSQISLDEYVFNTEAHPLKRPK